MRISSDTEVSSLYERTLLPSPSGKACRFPTGKSATRGLVRLQADIATLPGCFALDMELELERGTSHEEGRSAMEKHVLGRAELMGTYENKAERAA